jgi:hypothetical protein
MTYRMKLNDPDRPDLDNADWIKTLTDDRTRLDPRIIKRGGEGSGDIGHAGRPGEVGGSEPGGGEAKRVRLTKRAISDIMVWSPSRYNEISKKDAVELTYQMLRGERWDTRLGDASQAKPGEVTRPADPWEGKPQYSVRRDEEVFSAGSYTESATMTRWGSYYVNAKEGYIVAGDDRNMRHFNDYAAFLEKGPRVYFQTPLVEKAYLEERGGQGSGNIGHAGRPGLRGGSMPGGGGASDREQAMGDKRVKILKQEQAREVHLAKAANDKEVASCKRYLDGIYNKDDQTHVADHWELGKQRMVQLIGGYRDMAEDQFASMRGQGLVDNPQRQAAFRGTMSRLAVLQDNLGYVDRTPQDMTNSARGIQEAVGLMRQEATDIGLPKSAPLPNGDLVSYYDREPTIVEEEMPKSDHMVTVMPMAYARVVDNTLGTDPTDTQPFRDSVDRAQMHAIGQVVDARIEAMKPETDAMVQAMQDDPRVKGSQQALSEAYGRANATAFALSDEGARQKMQDIIIASNGRERTPEEVAYMEKWSPVIDQYTTDLIACKDAGRACATIQSQVLEEHMAGLGGGNDDISMKEGDPGGPRALDPMSRESMQGAEAYLRKITSPDVTLADPVPCYRELAGDEESFRGFNQLNPGSDRQPGIYLPEQTDTQTFVHEMGHSLEEENAGIHDATRALLLERAQGTALSKYPCPPYKPYEEGYRDAFKIDEYAGKLYGNSIPRAYQSEVYSMGLQRLYRDPASFARDDRKWFDFTVLNATGYIGKDTEWLRQNMPIS